MITKFKIFENSNIEPEVGYYVLMRINLTLYEHKDEVNNFINNTIGQIIDVIPDTDEIRVKYDNVPDIIKPWFMYNKIQDRYSRIIRNDKIVAIGKTLEDVKLNQDIIKYNL